MSHLSKITTVSVLFCMTLALLLGMPHIYSGEMSNFDKQPVSENDLFDVTYNLNLYDELTDIEEELYQCAVFFACSSNMAYLNLSDFLCPGFFNNPCEGMTLTEIEEEEGEGVLLRGDEGLPRVHTEIVRVCYERAPDFCVDVKATTTMYQCGENICVTIKLRKRCGPFNLFWCEFTSRGLPTQDLPMVIVESDGWTCTYWGTEDGDVVRTCASDDESVVCVTIEGETQCEDEEGNLIDNPADLPPYQRPYPYQEVAAVALPQRHN